MLDTFRNELLSLVAMSLIFNSEQGYYGSILSIVTCFIVLPKDKVIVLGYMVLACQFRVIANLHSFVVV